MVNWVRELRKGPQPIPVYTITTLPDPAQWNNCIAQVSNGAGGKTIVSSINSVWRYANGVAV
jgi:hypothetical protein